MTPLLTIALRALPLALAGCAGVPNTLAPPPSARAIATVAATGVQIYECRRAKDGSLAWNFVAPEASLLDARGQRVGSHGAGPFWQAQDGSRIVGRVLARADAPVAGAIPWLLLETHSTGAPGAYSAITHVQRLNTLGGAAPAAPCTTDHIGQSARIDYTADYRFFTH
jgi:Protein of unknown function (DUF3455)